MNITRWGGPSSETTQLTSEVDRFLTGKSPKCLRLFRHPDNFIEIRLDVGSKPSESSCLLHESRTNIIVRMDLRSLVELAHDKQVA